MTTILNAFLRYITVIETTLVFTAFSITAYVCNQQGGKMKIKTKRFLDENLTDEHITILIGEDIEAWKIEGDLLYYNDKTILLDSLYLKILEYFFKYDIPVTITRWEDKGLVQINSDEFFGDYEISLFEGFFYSCED